MDPVTQLLLSFPLGIAANLGAVLLAGHLFSLPIFVSLRGFVASWLRGFL
jgi:hypothetical protein